jgi:hypothetical protein
MLFSTRVDTGNFDQLAGNVPDSIVPAKDSNNMAFIRYHELGSVPFNPANAILTIPKFSLIPPG